MDQIAERAQSLLELLGPNPYVQAAVIVLAFVLLARIADMFITRVIGRLTANTATNLDEKIIAILHRPVFVTVVLIGLGIATLRISLADTPTYVTIGILKTIGVWIWVVFLMRFSRLALTALSGLPDRFRFVEPRTLPLLQNLVLVLLLAFAIYAIFVTWDIDVTAWLASAGIVGLALSFAAKDTLANLFAGVSILVDAPYQVGDFIVLESGERGQVTHIGIRSSRILTRDDVEITVPNSVLGTTKIINETGGPHAKYRIRVKVGVAYGSDIDKVREVLKGVAADSEMVCESPAPRVRFRTFGDSSLDFELLCWVDQPVLRGKALDRLNVAVYKRFMAEDIEIPFPQRDLHVKQMPTPPAAG